MLCLKAVEGLKAVGRGAPLNGAVNPVAPLSRVLVAGGQRLWSSVGTGRNMLPAVFSGKTSQGNTSQLIAAMLVYKKRSKITGGHDFEIDHTNLPG